MIDWSRCENNSGGYLDDCIVLHEYTATGKVAIRQLIADFCVNPANETCQNGHRIKYQALLTISDNSAGGAYAFQSVVEVKQYAKIGIGRFATHKLLPTSSGLMSYANNAMTVDFFDAHDVFTEGYNAYFASEEGFKCTSCGTYTYNKISTVVGGAIATSYLMGDNMTSPALKHMGAALSDQSTAIGLIYMVTDEDMMSPMYDECLQECGQDDFGLDVCDDDEDLGTFTDVDGDGNPFNDFNTPIGGGEDEEDEEDEDNEDNEDDDDDEEGDDTTGNQEEGDDQSGGGYDIGEDECDGSSRSHQLFRSTRVFLQQQWRPHHHLA